MIRDWWEYPEFNIPDVVWAFSGEWYDNSAIDYGSVVSRA